MQLIKLNIDSFDKEDIKTITDVILNGGIVVLPTDTVPGLIADASNSKAVEKIFAIKKRSPDMKLPVFVSDIDMARELAEINEEQEKELMGKWPGRYTFVLKRKKHKKELFGLDNDTIALRIPSYPLLNEILKSVDTPLVQTSVNPSGSPFLVQHEEIIDYLEKNEIQPDLVIDVGVLAEAQPSTIIDLSNNKVIRK